MLTKVVNQEWENEFWTRFGNKSFEKTCEQNLWTKVLKKISTRLLSIWTKNNIYLPNQRVYHMSTITCPVVKKI